MPHYRIERGGRSRGTRTGRVALIVALLLLLIGGRSIASYTIDFEWWKELGQTRTWFSMLTYALAPLAGATLLAFAVLWVAHARGLRFAGTSLREHGFYAKITTLLLLGLGFIVSASSIDTWTVVRYAGSRGLSAEAGAWSDSVFAMPLSFYLFDLPFYSLLCGYTATFLARNEIVWNDHGFMVGVDYVDSMRCHRWVNIYRPPRRAVAGLSASFCYRALTGMVTTGPGIHVATN
jgi:uncharacterized membrane protein (UPF0182 family)